MRTFFYFLLIVSALLAIVWYTPAARNWVVATYTKQVTQGIDVQRDAPDQYDRTLINAAEVHPCPSAQPDCLTRELLNQEVERTKRLNNGIDVPVGKEGHVFSLMYRARVESGLPVATSVFYSDLGELTTLDECARRAGTNSRTAVLTLLNASRPVGGNASGSNIERSVVFSGGDEIICQTIGAPFSWND